MLPNLENAADVEIVPVNIHAVQAIYATYQLEEARVFQVVERIAELFGQGMLRSRSRRPTGARVPQGAQRRHGTSAVR
jgi:hypothetical protein